MSLFDALFKAKETIKIAREAKAYFKTLTAYQPAFHTWRGAIYESELVRSAIDARARHISKLKVEILGSAKPALQTVLKQRPNSFQTWSQFLYRTSTILDVNNTCFIVPMLDKDGSTTGLFTVLPERCAIVDYKGKPYLRYKFMTGDIAAIELERCAVLTKMQLKDDFFGTSNAALDPTMSLIDLQNQGTQEAIRNGATYRFMAQLANFTKHEDLIAERERFSEDNFGKDAKGGGLLLFPNTYSNIQRLEAKNYTIDADQLKIIHTNVYNYFGVNEDILQNKAYGDMWSAFYEGAIEPFAIQFSETVTFALFSGREIANGAGVMATANRLQYLSNTDKLNVSAQMADRGIMTRNEIREIWNLPPIPGGDVATIRGEYYTLGEDGQKEDVESE